VSFFQCFWVRVFDFAVLLRRASWLDRLRTAAGPRPAVLVARRMGEQRRIRSDRERRSLRGMIFFIDRRWRGGPNCYRRVLLEIAMDGGAAREIVQLGFRSGGGDGSGHAWLGPDIMMDGKSPSSYDAIVSI
jgi:hypothetical protein